MQLYRLVYYSEAIDGLSLQDVKSIAEKASVKNASLFISGGLLYCEGKFLQVLEGGIHPVNKLFATILQDKRHKNINLIEFARVKRRAFEGWEMSLVFFPTSRDFQPEYIKYSGDLSFDPLSLDGDSCVEFLRNLLERKRTVLSSR
ncbi:MAG: BLUF domain-containing protein [Chloroherpetonaceae bacterium]|nr:BLUF domain-containing protein [Chloroherpetonaceae bacterium]MDW8437145.1 BLUF domain-containing protein [Chloroherpetonaceae bacterium]